MIPQNPVTENDIYAMMRELKFHIQLVDITEMVENEVGDKQLAVLAQVYKWKLYVRL
ncbi:hypothetical protein ACT4RS_07460 [Ornithobacterium rhinotracheale]|uniref:hypothetical protein n=1 Tax=Ornithobacterium rhinotracheale TaxID=28251 RepID=UPI004036BC49